MSLDRVLGMDIEWVLYHIVHDSPDSQNLYLDVDFYNDDVWSRLLASLPRNFTISTVKIERNADGDGSRTEDEIQSLFSLLSRIPSIEKLTFGAIVNEDFNAALPLLRHNNLRYCHLDWSGVEFGDHYMFSSRVGLALAEARALTDLVLEDPPVEACSFLLVPILQSECIKSIKVQSYGTASLGPDDTLAIFQALQNNTSMLEFSLGYLLEAHSYRFVPDMIRQLRTLEVLQLTIATNNSMEPFLQQLLLALKDNQSLTSFESCSANSTVVSKAMENLQSTVLEQNTTLKSLSIFKEQSATSRDIKTMFLKLNAAGRKSLQRQDEQGRGVATTEDWLDVMGGASDNLSCLFFCLIMNPSLCRLVVPCNRMTRKRKR